MGEWKEVTISKGTEEVIDYRGKTPRKSECGILLISAANIKKGKLDFTKDSYISEADYKEWTTRGFTKPGDILITTEAPAGEVALYPNEGVYQISRRVIALRIDEDNLHGKFLYYSFLNPKVKNRLLSANRGSTLYSVF